MPRSTNQNWKIKRRQETVLLDLILSCLPFLLYWYISLVWLFQLLFLPLSACLAPLVLLQFFSSKFRQPLSLTDAAHPPQQKNFKNLIMNWFKKETPKEAAAKAKRETRREVRVSSALRRRDLFPCWECHCDCCGLYFVRRQRRCCCKKQHRDNELLRIV